MANKIYYFTNALDNESFKSYLKDWKVSPNLSNQNFHNKLIRALAITNKVEVFSVRAINRNFNCFSLRKLVINEGNVTWRYPFVSISKVGKFLFLNRRIKNVSPKEIKDGIVYVDALNLSLVKEATKFAEKHHLEIVGVCTDNPNNISFVKESYNKKLLALANSFDKYVVLTEKINEVYNPNGKPYIRIDGVNEEVSNLPEREIEGDYIYFGGSLMKRYGVFNVIEAFKELKRDNLKLVLCGHHVNKAELESAIKDNENILYLGAVSYEENASLEKYSLVSINPRPIDPSLDEYSIPSKSLEALANGTINITVDNKLLKEKYEDVIIWAKTGDVKDIKEALEKVLSMSKKEREALNNKGKEKVMHETSLQSINKKLVF